MQDICTRPFTCAWDKQQIDSDCLCNKGKSLVCFTATEVTIDRDNKTCQQGTQHSTARLAGNICNCSVINHKIFQQLKSHDGVQRPTFCSEMINNIYIRNDYLLYVAFNDEAWKLFMQQHSMPETAQR